MSVRNRKLESIGHMGDVMGSLLAGVSARNVAFSSDHIAINDSKFGSKRSRDSGENEASDSPSSSRDEKKLSKQAKKLDILKSTAKGRGRMAAAEDGYRCVSNETLTTETGASVSEFECKTCSKRFKLEQVRYT